MIDFNWTEITILALLAVLIFGPEKLPQFARQAARVIAQLRRLGTDARGQLRAELGPEWDNVHLSDLNPKAFVARHVLSADEKEDLLTIRDEFKSAGELAAGGLSDVREGIEDAKAEARAGDAASGLMDPDPASSDLLRAVAFDPEAT